MAFQAPPPLGVSIGPTQPQGDPESPPLHQRNALREGGARWLGFLNELAESAQFLLPKPVIKASYVIATGYAFADALNLARKAYTNKRQQGEASGEAATYGALTGIDAMLFHLNATIAGLPIIIGKATQLAQSRLNPALTHQGWRRFAPLAAGLGTIAALYKGYDKLTDVALDMTFRKWFNLERQYIGQLRHAGPIIATPAQLKRPLTFEHFS